LIEGSILIVSKYRLENIRTRLLSQNLHTTKNKLLDFIINCEEAPIGHVYSVTLYQRQPDQAYLLDIEKIIETIQGDLIDSTEQASIPYFICGDLDIIKNAKSANSLMNTFFRSDLLDWVDASAFLLQSIPAYPNVSVCQDYVITTTPLTLSNNQTRPLAKVQLKNKYSFDLYLKNLTGTYWDKNAILLCKGNNAGASAGTDTDGNTSAEAHVSHTETDNKGNSMSVEVSGEVRKDRDGNSSASGRFSIDIDF
jgi:hypothetical protein